LDPVVAKKTRSSLKCIIAADRQNTISNNLKVLRPVNLFCCPQVLCASALFGNVFTDPFPGAIKSSTLSGLEIDCYSVSAKV
jgi:hypothetical protein